MPHPIMYADDDPGLAELRRLCLGLPGAEEKISHGRPVFHTGRIFAGFGGSVKLRPGEHRRWPSMLIVKIDPAELPAVDADERFLFPAYWGAGGWRGLDLAAPQVDWTEVGELVDASYRLIAPRRLVAELDARTAPD
ncbi:MAG: MmcQ/YjbR family DNA-binding protein [Nocardioides sp.]|uniref:MmcQ/YjbR family DNA-binding protein n=1 Tax=Nocardioides sp. TaxID=35761 RepID=UPI0039E49355